MFEIRRLHLLAALALVWLAAVPALSGAAGYYRYPDIHADRVVFGAEGDLWLAAANGGAAFRLTTHPGTEYFPCFSPDGRWIAFTGEYDGNRDVYLIQSEGGIPRRLTWHPAADEVVGWTPDGVKVLFRSSREDPNGTELFAVPAAGGDPEKLPLGWASRIDMDPATGLWAFNRSTWEGATWKRYRGGTAPTIWVGSPTKADFRCVTTFTGLNAYPMWHGDRIYFLSDQGGTANIWSMRADGSDRRPHTRFTEWDVRWPAMGSGGKIVFTLGADLHLLDLTDDKVRKLDIDLPSEQILTRTRYPEAARSLTWLDLSPKADRLAVVTRGEIFSVPVKDGVTLPVSRGSGARESWAGFSPDGKRLVYVSDATREEEIRTIDAWGRGEPKVIQPAGESGWHFPPVFSPDGKWIAYADQTQSLYVMPAEGGASWLVDRSPQAEIREYTWSPDGRWLAYAKALRNDYASIFIFDTQEKKSHAVTGPTTNDRSPAWDPEGRYLYFVSDRSMNPILGGQDLQNLEAKNSVLLMALLRKDVRNPFANLAGLPDSDQDKTAKAEKNQAEPKATDDKATPGGGTEAAGKKDEEVEKPPKPVVIDLAGLAERIVQLPVERGVYGNLGATAKSLFFLSFPIKGMAEGTGLFEEGSPDATLMVFELEKKKPKPFLSGVSAYLLAAKADKAAVMKTRGEIYVVDTGAPPGDLSEAKVSMNSVVVELDPRQEWEQMYYEGWRHQRDFFWDPALGGLDWKAVRDRYATLLPRLGTREDLRDLLGELIGELNNSHTYVFGGDPGVRVARVTTGLLGADLKREGDFYKVVRIFRGDPADNVRSPLQDPGVEVAEGNYILAINHAPFPAGQPCWASFDNLAGKEVVLTVNAKPALEGSRDVVVKLMASEEDLRYSDWVRRNREYVAAKTGGRIGYIHLPNMGSEGLIEFNTWFYPQLDKEGMVVDVRWNGGGFVSQMILERFRRKVLSFDRARGGGVSTYPYRTLNGPFVVLTNEFAGSDGDIFPAAVQLERLAPVIGMRSWGGVVGIRGDKLLVDGGFLTEPEFAWWDPKQGWDLENRGVVPDIEVQNLPQDLARGLDAQLDRAIAEVLKLHQAQPPVKPEFGPVRPRTRQAFEKELK